MKLDQFEVEPGSIVFHKAGDEPLFVLDLTKQDGEDWVYVRVRRHVSPARNGSYYRTEQFRQDEVETAHARAIREADFMKFLFELRSQSEAPKQSAQVSPLN